MSSPYTLDTVPRWLVVDYYAALERKVAVYPFFRLEAALEAYEHEGRYSIAVIDTHTGQILAWRPTLADQPSSATAASDS